MGGCAYEEDKIKKMKLLIITQKVDQNDDVLGFFHGWIREFAKHYEKVTVIALGVGEYDLPKNVSVLSLGKEHGVSRIGYILNFYRYIWRERKNYDTVFVHMNPIYVVLGSPLWRIWSKKVGLWYTHKHVNIKLRLAEKFANIIFTASLESFRLTSKKVSVMGHGIDVEMFKPQEKNDDRVFHVVTAGRISPVKDYETLISAVELLVRENILLHVEIIGDAVIEEHKKYFSLLKSLVREKNLKNYVMFVGAVSNRELPQYLQRADLFVNMSHTGSLDKAVLEAMSCGVPVITSNEAFREVFGPDKEMLMFRMGNVSEFAQKIKMVQSLSSIKKQEMTKRLRDVIVEKHNLKKLIHAVCHKYEVI